MSFSFQYPLSLLILSALLAAAFSFWSYYRTIPSLPAPRRTVLASFRFAAVFLICFLLFEPILRRTSQRAEVPVVAVLIDDSQSIHLQTSAQESISPNLASTLSRLSVPEGAEVRAFRFGGSIRPLDGDRMLWSDSLTSGAERTDIAGALASVRTVLRDAPLAGVILISDGRYNTGSNPVYTAERYPVPIHSVVVGDTTQRRDVSISRVVANRIAYADAEQPVEIEISSLGYPGERLRVVLSEGERELATTVIEITGEQAQVPVRLHYTPQSAGLRSLTIRVTEMEGELTLLNNRYSLPVRVLEQRRQILLVAGAPGPDVSAVRQILGRDTNADLTVRVQKSATEFYEGDLPASLDEFDALVLVGFPGRATARAVAGRLARAASGAPLVFVLSRDTNLPMLTETFGEVLPASTRGERSGWMEAHPILTPEGQGHPVFDSDHASATDWLRLPPLLMSESRWHPTPDARVLAAARVRDVDLDDPLIVARARGGIRSLAILGAGTWRWRNVPAGLAEWEDLWPNALSAAVQWITASRDQRPVRVDPTQEIFAGDDAVQFTAEVYDESLRPLSGALVEVEVVDSIGTRIPFRMEDAGNGQYRLNASTMGEGTYTYQAVARRDGREIGRDDGTFVVGELGLEQRDTRADPDLMRQIAARSGGHFLSGHQAGELSSMLGSSPSLQPRTASIVNELRLRRMPHFLLLIILLLSAEWVLRKRSGLA